MDVSHMLRAALLLSALIGGSVDASIKQVALSGRCVGLAESPDNRVATRPQFTPGQPPILSFRFYEGKLHHRFGNSELLLDDAGH
jgi:hypothetical protein